MSRSPTDMEDAQSSQLRKHLPESRLAVAAFEFALESLPAPILNHSVRVFLLANWLATKEQSSYATADLDSLFVACLFHDFGATETHNHAERFEICGADAAVRFLTGAETLPKQDVNEAPPLTSSLNAVQAWDIWTAIALHTSAGIAERIHPLARLLRLGVLIDFRRATREKFEATEYAQEVENDIPRLEIEKILADEVVRQALTKQAGDARDEKAPRASWPGILLRSHLEDPSWKGINRAF